MIKLYQGNNHFSANWFSRSATVCFTCARNIVFQHRINFCFDVEHMVCFTCVWLSFICASFEFTMCSFVITLSLRSYWAHGELKMASNQHIVNTKQSWTHTNTNMVGLPVNILRLKMSPLLCWRGPLKIGSVRLASPLWVNLSPACLCNGLFSPQRSQSNENLTFRINWPIRNSTPTRHLI